ncbi:MAG: Rab family GTPase [Candidatus Hodarchaeota archaeon]
MINYNSKNEYLLKICAIGSSNTGKSKIIRYFTEGKFTTNYLPTLGVDITTKTIKVDNNKVKLILVDTAGQEFFGKLRPSYYRGASACVIFFSLNDRSTFDSVPDWLKEFRYHVPDASVPISLIAINDTKRIQVKKRINKSKNLPKSKNLVFRGFEVFLNWFFSNQNKKLRLPKKKYEKKQINHHKTDHPNELAVSSQEAKKLAKRLGMNYCELYLQEPICFMDCLIQLVRDAILIKDEN